MGSGRAQKKGHVAAREGPAPSRAGGPSLLVVVFWAAAAAALGSCGAMHSSLTAVVLPACVVGVVGLCPGDALGFWARRAAFYLFSGLLLDILIKEFGEMQFLTNWTLVLHALYFELDVQNPSARVLVRILQGASFAGAHGVLGGWAASLKIGTLDHGLWTPRAEAWAWEDQSWLNMHPGRALVERPERWAIGLKMLGLHVAPVLAHWCDLFLNRDALRRHYVGAPAVRAALRLWFFVGFFAYGQLWETCNPTTTKAYNAPQFMIDATYKFAAMLGVSAETVRSRDNALGIGEDFVFSWAVKSSGSALFALANLVCFRSLFAAPAAKNRKKE